MCDAPNLSAAGGQRLWRGHPAIEMVAKVPADDREGAGPMVKRDAGIDFEIIGLRQNIVDDVLVRIFQSTRYPQHVAVGKRSDEHRHGNALVSRCISRRSPKQKK